MAELRRWTPFLGTFAQIDATIEAAAGYASREAFRRERNRIVDALRDATDDDDVAEEICALLDAAMAESLVTLRDVVPASAVKDALTSGEVVEALGKLMAEHASARVRGLAGDVARVWRAGVQEEVATARAALHVLDSLEKTVTVSTGGYRDNLATKRTAQIVSEKELVCPKKQTAAPIVRTCDAKTDKVSEPRRQAQAQIIPEKQQMPLKKPAIIGSYDAKRHAEIVSIVSEKKFPKKPEVSAIVSSCDAKTAKGSNPKKNGPGLGCIRVKASAEIPAPPPSKKTSPTTIGRAGDKRMMRDLPISAEEKKIEDTKRKLHARYQEAENAKRLRTIRVIEAPPQKTTRPAAMRARGITSCAGQRRFIVPSLRMV